MKNLRLACVVAVLSVAVAQAAPLDDLRAAIRLLTEASSYTWIVTPDPKVPRPVRSEWQANQQGWMVGRWVPEREPYSVSDGRLRFTRGDAGDWRRNDPTDPATLRATVAIDTLSEVVAGLENVRREGDLIVGDLSTDAITKQLTFGYGAPTMASGQARFWIRDGRLQRYEVRRRGTVQHRDGSRLYDGTIGVEFTNVGSTEVVVPPKVRQLFGS